MEEIRTRKCRVWFISLGRGEGRVGSVDVFGLFVVWIGFVSFGFCSCLISLLFSSVSLCRGGLWNLLFNKL